MVAINKESVSWTSSWCWIPQLSSCAVVCAYQRKTKAYTALDPWKGIQTGKPKIRTSNPKMMTLQDLARALAFVGVFPLLLARPTALIIFCRIIHVRHVCFPKPCHHQLKSSWQKKTIRNALSGFKGMLWNHWLSTTGYSRGAGNKCLSTKQGTLNHSQIIKSFFTQLNSKDQRKGLIISRSIPRQ